MSNTIILKNSSAANAVPTLSDLEYGEVAVNTRDGIAYIKYDDGTGAKIGEIGSIKPMANTYFVQVTGNDTNNGRTWDTAFQTIERALYEANLRKIADPAAITLIDVGAGRYYSQGHLDMPDDCIIRAVHRTVILSPEGWPASETYCERNQFRMGSGCFLEGFLFEGWRLDSLDNPTEGFAVSFRPGAVIRRVPYAHKIAVRTVPSWDYVPPPQNPYTGNPLVPRGAGVALADGMVCSPYSIFPNIMTWGATPVNANGIGYCAKNGGLINAINAVSIWCHKHFLALTGGQIILSSCSTQFGDFSLVSNGSRDIIFPAKVTGVTLVIDLVAVAAITAAKQTIIDNMWTALSTTINPATGQVYTFGWTLQDEVYTRRDAANFLQVIIWVLQTADEIPMENFSKGFYDTLGNSIIDVDKLDAFIFSWDNMRDQINALPGVNVTAQGIVTALVVALENTINTPVKRKQPSTITAIGHTWTAILAGVALTKIPPAFNRATIQASILEQNDGVVIASGQDDQGSALFVGGMKIDADTGELSGPPFDQAVSRIATKSAIAFSGF
jgi:hypothetical protein